MPYYYNTKVLISTFHMEKKRWHLDASFRIHRPRKMNQLPFFVKQKNNVSPFFQPSLSDRTRNFSGGSASKWERIIRCEDGFEKRTNFSKRNNTLKSLIFWSLCDNHSNKYKILHLQTHNSSKIKKVKKVTCEIICFVFQIIRKENSPRTVQSYLSTLFIFDKLEGTWNHRINRTTEIFHQILIESPKWRHQSLEVDHKITVFAVCADDHSRLGISTGNIPPREGIRLGL